MTRSLLVLVWLGCTPSRPPVEPVPSHLAAAPLVPPPWVVTKGLVGPVEDLWPLDRAPILEPNLALSEAYGTGLGWRALCRARPDPVRTFDRDDLLAYLLAWCAIETGNLSAGSAALVALGSTKSPRVSDAVRRDLVGILAQGAASDGLARLDRASLHGVDLDALAAAYLAEDRIDDAALVMQQLTWRDARPGARCHRLIRAFVLRTESHDVLAGPLRDSQDPVCVAAQAMLDCPLAYGPWSPSLHIDMVDHETSGCAAVLDRRPDLAPRIHLARIYASWPEDGDWKTWLQLAMIEIHRAELDGAEATAVAALENAVMRSDCTTATRTSIAVVARSARVLPNHDPALDPRIAHLAELDQTWCGN